MASHPVAGTLEARPVIDGATRPRNHDVGALLLAFVNVDEMTRLTVRAQDEDRPALRAFIEVSQGDRWRFVAHQIGRGDADDVTQDVFVRTAIIGFDALRAVLCGTRLVGRNNGRVVAVGLAARGDEERPRTTLRRR